MDISREVEFQRDHYAETAREYHEKYVPQGDEHLLGLTFLVAAVDCFGYESGLSRDELIEGDATRIHFGDGEFDIVCAFGVLHHIRQASVAVSEMPRVARKAIFISDGNNFGQGRFLTRGIK